MQLFLEGFLKSFCLFFEPPKKGCAVVHSLQFLQNTFSCLDFQALSCRYVSSSLRAQSLNFVFLLNPLIDTEKGLSHKLIGCNFHLDPREPCRIPRIAKNNDHFLSHKRLATLCHLSSPAFSRFSTCSLQSAKNRVTYEWKTYS